MQFCDAAIPDVKIIKQGRHFDDRGFFSETFNAAEFRRCGVSGDFVQDNHSLSKERGVVRGLHFQIPPFAQAKLVRVTAGAAFDVAVDIRHASPTFGRHVAVVLSASEWNQIFIPEGFAHGFCTIEPDTEVQYKVNRYYSPAHDRGILWCDPALAIAWPVSGAAAIVSPKDRRHPPLAGLPVHFGYRV